MAAPNHRSSGVDRRASMRMSMRLSMQQGDDEYDLEAMGISDGFRPSDVTSSRNRMSSRTSQHDQSMGRRSPPPRPSSITKQKGLDSFALRHDGIMGPVLARDATVASSSSPNTTPTRSSSVSTDMTLMRAESPYQGPAGPSHPYQMYPQESRLARTASMATTSTVPVPERSYSGPSGPTHPYGMYPQNTVPEPESAHDRLPIAPIPVGFPGLRNDYQRRLGPEGEEVADIIGPDGHTEQLPPYTQYPDEAFARKTRPTVQPPLAGAGGIGLATRNPEFASREDLNSPQSRQSTRSLMSDASVHQVNIAALGDSEKPPLKKWQKAARRRVCGIIPIWVIVLTAAVFFLFGIILGSVLAALRPKHHPTMHHPGGPDADNQSTVYATMTTTFDAAPLSSLPPGIPTLPTGTFALPISVPSTSQSSCIDNSAQSNAWSCSIPLGPLQMTVTSIADTTNINNNEIVMDLGNNSLPAVYPYGSQPPVITPAQVMSLVTDSEDPGRGPAWFFQIPYNKVVILEEDDLALSHSKRDVNPPSPSADIMRKGVAQPGEKPWFCFWNGTLLETFIYVNETSSGASQSSSTTTSGAPSKMATAMSSYASNIFSATSIYAYSVPTSNVQPLGSSSSGPPSGPPSGPSDPQFLNQYPKVLKVEERRVLRGAQAIPPYCVQHLILEDGSAVQYMNSTGQPVTIYLNETESSIVSRSERDIFGNLKERDVKPNERDTTNSCSCIWLLS